MNIKSFIIKFAHIFPNAFLFFWDHKDMQKRKIFRLNLMVGIAVSCVLWNAYSFKSGYSLLNEVYDSLVIEDFKQAVLKSERDGNPPISDHIRIVSFKHSNGFWTPRAELGKSIFRAIELGAKVLVIDIDVNTPAPVVCDKANSSDENQIFLDYLKQAAIRARSNHSVIVLPHAEKIQGEYGRRLGKLISDYKDVVKTGIVTAFRDTSDYQARHLRFYKKKDGQVYFSVQILAAVYFYYSVEQGDKIIREKTAEIAHEKEKIRLSFPERDVILCSQDDPDTEHLEARYLFRLAPRDVTNEVCGNVSDPLVAYPDLYLSPAGLLNRDSIYKGKIVIIGSEDKQTGDFHATPLGDMPGFYLIVNGINLILEGLQIHEAIWIIRIFIELLVILVSSVVGIYLPPTVSVLILAALFFASFSSFSFWLFSNYCLFIDFWLPVVGVELGRLLSDMLEFLAGFFGIFNCFSQKKEYEQ